jgi:hypothetical protein
MRPSELKGVDLLRREQPGPLISRAELIRRLIRQKLAERAAARRNPSKKTKGLSGFFGWRTIDGTVADAARDFQGRSSTHEFAAASERDIRVRWRTARGAGMVVYFPATVAYAETLHAHGIADIALRHVSVQTRPTAEIALKASGSRFGFCDYLRLHALPLPRS